jgi:hypothetical protein
MRQELLLIAGYAAKSQDLYIADLKKLIAEQEGCITFLKNQIDRQQDALIRLMTE